MTDGDQATEAAALGEDGRYICGLYHPRRVLDVGANLGKTVAMWLEYGVEKVYALEPVPDVYVELAKRFAGDPRVVEWMIAASDSEGVAQDMNIKNCWTLMPHGDAALDPALEYAGAPPFSVAFTRIDRLLSEQGLEPDLIKIDVDGYEARALRGARGYLLRRRPPIVLEVSYLPSFVGDCCECMIRRLFEIGYKSIERLGPGWSEGPRYTDARAFMRVFPWDTSFDVLVHPGGTP